MIPRPYLNTHIDGLSGLDAPESIRALIRGGARINRANKYQNTALIFASDSGHTETARVLLKTARILCFLL